MDCFRIGTCTCKGKNIIFQATPKTGSWYRLGILFNISDKQPHPFNKGVPPSDRILKTDTKSVHVDHIIQ